MKILITGANGFIGKNLYTKLIKLDDYQITLVDNTFDKLQAQQPDLDKASQVITCDLLKSDELPSFDIVFHCAALLGVDFVEQNPFKTVMSNINMFNPLINNLVSSNTRFVFLSTSEVYGDGNKDGKEFENNPNDKLQVPDLSDNRSSYALSKIVGEFLAGINKNTLIIRPHNIVGPQMGEKHVIPQLFNKIFSAENYDNVYVFNTEHIRCFCDIDDAIDQIIFWSLSGATGIKNVGNPTEPITMEDLFYKMASLSEKKLNCLPATGHLSSPKFRKPVIENSFSYKKLDTTLKEMFISYSKKCQ